MQGWHLSRRTLFQVLLGALWRSRGLATVQPQTNFDILRGFSPAVTNSRRYRIDATILLLHVPVGSRNGVGGAYASVEAASGEAGNAVALQFAAGSWPERAHGINRFGIWREAVLEHGAEQPEIAFAGLITESREETLAQARSVLSASTSLTEAIVARGSLSSGTARTWIDRVQLSRDSLWTGLGKILCDAMRQQPHGSFRESVTAGCTTFLHAIRGAAFQSPGQARVRFTHSGRVYVLETRRSPQQPLAMTGVIRDHLGAKCSEFSAFYAPEDDSGLPIRIEYRPRSFLRLTFEAEREAHQPVIPSVFEENA